MIARSGELHRAVLDSLKRAGLEAINVWYDPHSDMFDLTIAYKSSVTVPVEEVDFSNQNSLDIVVAHLAMRLLRTYEHEVTASVRALIEKIQPVSLGGQHDHP